MARSSWTRGRVARSAIAAAIALAAGAPAQPASAASSKGCTGGAFTLIGANGTVIAGEKVKTSVASLGSHFAVKGRYVEFTVDASTFGVRDWTLTGAANPIDITGGRRTPVFAEKVPDHRGLSLTSRIQVRLDDEKLRLEREGRGVEMKIQSKDCAQGGIFQMEPEREDGTATRITHRLAAEAFYFDNPYFRARAGQVLNGVTVNPRVNFGNDHSPDFVGRDSAQVAERVDQGCVNVFGTHCGGESQWDVASGGRMGQVMGEDSVEVAPPPTECTENCQAQNQVRGRYVVLGFPFPVPQDSRLTPRFPPAPAV